MSAPAPGVAFRWTYIGWLICLLVIVYAFLVVIGAVAGDVKGAFVCLLALALALFFGTIP